MTSFFRQFRQLGGAALLREYIRRGVFWHGVGQFASVACRRKTLGEADNDMRRLIQPMLREEFYPIMLQLKRVYEGQERKHERSNIVCFAGYRDWNRHP